MPSLSRMPAMTRDAAMKTSTWRYFHFENAWRFRWKSTRRAATTSGLRGRPFFICSAIAASATPIGSCAWTTSGFTSRSTWPSCQAACTSNSLRGEKPTKRRPSCARRFSSPPSCATSTAGWPSSSRPVTSCRTWFWPPRQVRAVSMWTERTSRLMLSRSIAAGPMRPQLRELQEHVVRVHRPR